MISGFPCSGKTTRATQIHDFFVSKIAEAQAALKSHSPSAAASDTTASENARNARIRVHIVNGHEGLGIDREVYKEARSEKNARAAEYSAVKRLLSQDDVVIADGPNYIKGYRYQLYCEAKAVLTPSCVVSNHQPIKGKYHTR